MHPPHLPYTLEKASPSDAGRTGESGLSLVEVLVTLAISALAAVMIVATARPADPLRTEGERLTRTLEQLNGRARISGKPTGLIVEANGYSGVAWTDGGWSALPRIHRSLIAGIEITSPPAKLKSSRDDNIEPPTPQLVFDPLGHSQIEPVRLRAEGRELTVALPEQAARGTP
jgi:type II secretion system protein H